MVIELKEKDAISYDCNIYIIAKRSEMTHQKIDGNATMSTPQIAHQEFNRKTFSEKRSKTPRKKIVRMN